LKEDKVEGKKTRESWVGYLSLSLGLCFLYLVTIPAYITYSNSVVPMGDPFSYTVAWFEVLDRSSFEYIYTLKWASQNQMYALMNSMIALFSPILIKEPFSVALVNFLMFGFATLSYFRLARFLKLSVPLSFILAWVMWIFPVNFGFLAYSSVPMLGLDAMFLGIQNAAIANLLIWALQPNRRANAVLAGLSLGLCFWARGNALPIVGMVVFPVLVFVLYRLFKNPKKEEIQNFALVSGISLFFCINFLWNH